MPTPTIKIDEDKCLRDGLCAAVCPMGIIAPEGGGKTPRPRPEMLPWCIGCGHCVAVCLSEALEHSSMAACDCPALSAEHPPNAGQVAALMHTRRSMRRFKAEPPDRTTLARAIAMAAYAPSGHNGQPVNWIVYDRREDIRRIAEMTVTAIRAGLDKEKNPARQMLLAGVVAAWDQGRDVILHDAPCLVVAHCKPRVSTEAIDAALAMGYLDLAAVSFGLGCCWAGLFMTAAVKWPPIMEWLDLPEGHRIYGALMVGQPRFKYKRAPLRKKPSIAWRSQG